MDGTGTEVAEVVAARDWIECWHFRRRSLLTSFRPASEAVKNALGRCFHLQQRSEFPFWVLDGEIHFFFLRVPLR